MLCGIEFHIYQPRSVFEYPADIYHMTNNMNYSVDIRIADEFLTMVLLKD